MVLSGFITIHAREDDGLGGLGIDMLEIEASIDTKSLDSARYAGDYISDLIFIDDYPQYDGLRIAPFTDGDSRIFACTDTIPVSIESNWIFDCPYTLPEPDPNFAILYAESTSDRAVHTMTFRYTSTGHTTGSPPAQHSVTLPGRITLRQPGMTRAGHTFGGWRWENNVWSAGHTFDFAADHPMRGATFTFIAVWTPNAPTATFQYTSFGHTTGSPPASHSVNLPGSISLRLNTMTRTGHSFGGWRNGNNIFEPGRTFNFSTADAGTYSFDAVWWPNATLTVSPTTWNPPATASSTNITIHTNQTHVNVSSNQSWLTWWQSSGNTITLQASANTGSASRSATVTVSTAGLSRTISVTQAAATTQQIIPSISLNQISNITLNQSITVSGSASIPPNTSPVFRMAASVTEPNGNVIWLSHNYNTTSYVRTFTPTQTGAHTVTLFARSLPDGSPGQDGRPTIADPSSGQNQTSWVFTVNAAAAIIPTSVSVTPNPVSLNVGQTQQLTESVLPTNATNRTVTWSSSNTNVATVSTSGEVAARAAGSATITATTNSGNRTGTSVVTVSAVQVPVATLEFRDTSGQILNVAPWDGNALDAPYSGRTVIATVVTNQAEWNAVSSDLTWLHVSQSGTASGSRLTISALRPNTDTVRSGTVTVTAGNQTRTLHVTQDMSRLTVSPTTWAAPAAAGSHSFNVTTINQPTWYAEIEDGVTWIRWRRVAHALVLETDPNIGLERSGTVTVVAGTLREIITVTQTGAHLPIVTMPYELLLNSTTSRNAAIAGLYPAKRTFMNEFRIDITMTAAEPLVTHELDQRGNCRSTLVYGSMRQIICDPSICGVSADGSDCRQRHHRSSVYFVTTLPGNRNLNRFRFVDFSLCWIGPNRPHSGAGGVAHFMHYDMLVSTIDERAIAKITAHEIAHLFGARDHDPNDRTTYCVMGHDPLMRFDIWCDICRDAILRNRNR